MQFLQHFDAKQIKKFPVLILFGIVFVLSAGVSWRHVIENPVKFDKNTALTTKEVSEVSKWIKTQRDARCYGYLAFSAPVVSLYSSTKFYEFSRIPLMYMPERNFNYFVDQAYNSSSQKKIVAELKEKYKMVDIFPENKYVKIFQFNPKKYQAIEYDKFDEKLIKENISTGGHSKWRRGRDGNWISSDCEFLLRTPLETEDFFIDIALAENFRYVYPKEIEFYFSVNGNQSRRCSFSLDKEWRSGRIRLPKGKMNFPLNSIVSVRILSNNVCHSWRWVDTQVSAVVDFLGFEGKDVKAAKMAMLDILNEKSAKSDFIENTNSKILDFQFSQVNLFPRLDEGCVEALTTIYGRNILRGWAFSTIEKKIPDAYFLITEDESGQATIKPLGQTLRKERTDILNKMKYPDSFYSGYEIRIPQSGIILPEKKTRWAILGYFEDSKKVYLLNINEEIKEKFIVNQPFFEMQRNAIGAG